MTRHRGFKERTSKSGVESSYAPFYEEKRVGYTTKKDVIVREDPNSKVVDIIFTKGTKVKILSKLDSKWVQVTTPSGITGVCGADYIMEEE